MLRPEPEADTNALYLRACAEAGFAPRVAQHVTSLQSLLGFVSAGLGWAFVPRSVVRSIERAGVALVSLRGTTARLPTALAWPEDRLTAPAQVVREAAEKLA